MTIDEMKRIGYGHTLYALNHDGGGMYLSFDRMVRDGVLVFDANDTQYFVDKENLNSLLPVLKP